MKILDFDFKKCIKNEKMFQRIYFKKDCPLTSFILVLKSFVISKVRKKETTTKLFLNLFFLKVDYCGLA